MEIEEGQQYERQCPTCGSPSAGDRRPYSTSATTVCILFYCTEGHSWREVYLLDALSTRSHYFQLTDRQVVEDRDPQ